MAVSGSRRPRPSLLTRIARAAHAELSGIRFPLLIAQVCLALIPRMAFGWLRPALYRLAGVRIGPQTRIYGTMVIEGQGDILQHLSIGAGCLLTTPLFLNASGVIAIGDRVTIGHHVVIITDNHAMDDPEHRAGERYSAPVIIENGAWIGARATILPGVTLGHGCVVAAGAVVARDVPADTLVAGVPARPIKQLKP